MNYRQREFPPGHGSHANAAMEGGGGAGVVRG